MRDSQEPLCLTFFYFAYFLSNVTKQAQERHGSAEERIQRMETNIEEKNAEIIRLNQRLKMNEEHNQRLSATVDKLLSESNDRLQVHLKERMHALDEKNILTQELEKTRKLAEELHQEKNEVAKELAKTRLEIENYKRQLLQQEIAYNIEQTEALTRSLSPNNAADQQLAAAAAHFQRSASNSAFDVNSLRRKQQEQFHRSLAEQEWDALQQMTQAHVMANVQQAFVDGMMGLDGVDDGDNLFCNPEMLSPTGTGHTDAQSLAMMLQEQLDAINNEIRLIQEEKQTTEARAEELESRVGSIEHMNLLARGRAGPSPPASGRSTPNSPNMNMDYLQKYHNVSFQAIDFL